MIKIFINTIKSIKQTPNSVQEREQSLKEGNLTQQDNNTRKMKTPFNGSKLKSNLQLTTRLLVTTTNYT